jgi:hypothetical protein
VSIARISKCGRASAGVAMLELALLLPILVFLALMVADFARALQAELVLINITREGASIASRLPGYAMPTLMDSLGLTVPTPPMDMATRGMIYVTEVTAADNSGTYQVTAQTRWTRGSGHAFSSATGWTCAAWRADGTCNLPSPLPVVVLNQFPGNDPLRRLRSGQSVYVAEAFYDFNMLFGLRNFGFGMVTPRIGPDLAAVSIM